ncbi:NAD(P)/FAD-dependent oxidoreductase [soil metagenome]
MSSSSSELLDCMIVGGGAAGLTAAVYLARFRRNSLVVDAGESRLWSIPLIHNFPGFPEGINGGDLLQRLRAQAERYGARQTVGTVTSVKKLDEGEFKGFFSVSMNGKEHHARTVLIATGAEDIAPEITGSELALRHGCLRYCPVCDGYEAIGKKVAVLGRAKHGVDEALFIKRFTSDLSILTLGEVCSFTGDERERLAHEGIQVVESPGKLEYSVRERRVVLILEDGGIREYEILYSAQGLMIRSELAKRAGAAVTRHGDLVFDRHMQTTVENLYCAGDVAAGLNQISVAAGQAAIAATAIHNRL